MSRSHANAAKPVAPSLDAAAVEAEIREELQFHIDQVAAELVRSGWTIEAALVEARRRFGDASAIQRACKRERLKDRIMLQRINTALIVILIAAIAVFALRSDAAAAMEQHELESLRGAISQLGEQNEDLAELLRASRLAALRVAPGRSSRTDLPKAPPTMLDGSTPSTKAEEAFAAWIADRPGAARELARFGDEAVPLLIPVISGSVKVPGNRDGMHRMIAANILGDSGSPNAVPPLLEALEDEYMNVRRCAALALGKLGAVEAIPALEDLAENDPYVYRGSADGEPKALVRLDAAAALEQLRGASSAQGDQR